MFINKVLSKLVEQRQQRIIYLVNMKASDKIFTIKLARSLPFFIQWFFWLQNVVEKFVFFAVFERFDRWIRCSNQIIWNDLRLRDHSHHGYWRIFLHSLGRRIRLQHALLLHPCRWQSHAKHDNQRRSSHPHHQLKNQPNPRKHLQCLPQRWSFGSLEQRKHYDDSSRFLVLWQPQSHSPWT